jgi:hypothetical protein
MSDKKQPMISQSQRPSPIDFEQPLSNLKAGDLHTMMQTVLLPEIQKNEKVVEHVKPEQFKPENFKVEKVVEQLKPENFKVEKVVEQLKPESFKPEGAKPEGGKPGPIEIGQDTIEQIATRVADILKTRPG